MTITEAVMSRREYMKMGERSHFGGWVAVMVTGGLGRPDLTVL